MINLNVCWLNTCCLGLETHLSNKKCDFMIDVWSHMVDSANVEFTHHYVSLSERVSPRIFRIYSKAIQTMPMSFSILKGGKKKHVPSGKHTKNYGKIHHAING